MAANPLAGFASVQKRLLPELLPGLTEHAVEQSQDLHLLTKATRCVHDDARHTFYRVDWNRALSDSKLEIALSRCRDALLQNSSSERPLAYQPLIMQWSCSYSYVPTILSLSGNTAVRARFSSPRDSMRKPPLLNCLLTLVVKVMYVMQA